MTERDTIDLLRASFRFTCEWLAEHKGFTDFDRITIHGALPERIYPYTYLHYYDGHKYPLLARCWLEDGIPEILAKRGGMVDGKWFSNRVLQEWWAEHVRDPVIKTIDNNEHKK